MPSVLVAQPQRMAVSVGGVAAFGRTGEKQLRAETDSWPNWRKRPFCPHTGRDQSLDWRSIVTHRIGKTAVVCAGFLASLVRSGARVSYSSEDRSTRFSR